jgi:hypothetical protein
MKDSNIIARMIGQSFETVAVHEAILNDDTAWSWVQDQATMVWNGRTTQSGYTFNADSLASDLGRRIDNYVRSNAPAFQNDMWNAMIDWFLRSVDWFLIADWHFTNMWELALIDGWEDDAIAEQLGPDIIPETEI